MSESRVIEKGPVHVLWGKAGSSGESGDLAKTLEDVRRALSSGPDAKVRLSVGTREFGEQLIEQLSELETVRVTVVMRGERPGVEGRPTLEVRSNGGAILEGVFEVSERAAADLFVCSLSVGCGVRAKVIERLAGSTLADLKAAWERTPFPHVWSVVVKTGSRVALKVYDGWEDAEMWAKHLERVTGEPHERRSWVSNERPEVGKTYDETEAEPQAWAKIEVTEPKP